MALKQPVCAPALEVCFVRHGCTDWNEQGRYQGRRDIPLNDRGRAQAEACAAHLAAGRWDAVVASPLARARETAAIIAARLGLAVRVMDHFTERDGGALNGLTAAEREERGIPHPPPGFEDDAAVWSRVRSGLSELSSALAGGRALVVSHGGAIRVALAGMAGWDVWETGAQFDNTGLTTVRFADGVWNIVHVNDLPHRRPGLFA